MFQENWVRFFVQSKNTRRNFASTYFRSNAKVSTAHPRSVHLSGTCLRLRKTFLPFVVNDSDRLRAPTYCVWFTPSDAEAPVLPPSPQTGPDHDLGLGADKSRQSPFHFEVMFLQLLPRAACCGRQLSPAAKGLIGAIYDGSFFQQREVPLILYCRLLSFNSRSGTQESLV